MAKNEMSPWLIVAIAAFAYFIFVGNPFAAEPAAPVDQVGSVGGCNVEDVSLYAKMTRLGKAGTSVADNWYVITDNIGTIATATAQTVSTNYDMQIMFGENSTTYYTVVKTINTGCQDPKYEAVQLALADTSLNSFYAKNADGTVNSISNNQSVGTDDTFDATICFKAGSDTYFGNPNSDCQNIAVVQYDKTYVLKAEGDNPTAVPGSFSYSSATTDGSNAFFIPKSADGSEVCINVALTTTSTTFVPTTAGQPRITLFDCDVDKNEDTLAIIEGVEDEDLNSISLGAQTLITYLA